MPLSGWGPCRKASLGGIIGVKRQGAKRNTPYLAFTTGQWAMQHAITALGNAACNHCMCCIACQAEQVQGVPHTCASDWKQNMQGGMVHRVYKEPAPCQCPMELDRQSGPLAAGNQPLPQQYRDRGFQCARKLGRQSGTQRIRRAAPYSLLGLHCRAHHCNNAHRGFGQTRQRRNSCSTLARQTSCKHTS